MNKKMRDMDKIEFMRIPESVNRDDQTIEQKTKEASRDGELRRDSTTAKGFDCATIDSKTSLEKERKKRATSRGENGSSKSASKSYRIWMDI